MHYYLPEHVDFVFGKIRYEPGALGAGQTMPEQAVRQVRCKKTFSLWNSLMNNNSR